MPLSLRSMRVGSADCCSGRGVCRDCSWSKSLLLVENFVVLVEGERTILEFRWDATAQVPVRLGRLGSIVAAESLPPVQRWRDLTRLIVMVIAVFGSGAGKLRVARTSMKKDGL